MAIFQGSATAMSTPFTQDGVNYQEMCRLIDFQIQNGTDALVISGTTGEPSTMTLEEEKMLWQTASSHIAGRVPLIIGAGSNDTAYAVETANCAKLAGADALLIVTPYYNKCTPAGLFAHYNAIAQVGLPIIAYNVPGRTGMNITPAMLEMLCDIPNVVAIKEASANINQMIEMTRRVGSRMDFYSGEDAIVLPAMSLGFKGVISVASNIVPRLMHDLVMSYLSGDIETSRKLQFSVNPLVDALFCEVNPIPVKTALRLMGFDMGPFRLPLCDMAPNNLATLTKEMQAIGLLPA